MRTAWRTSKFWLPSSERAASKENCTVAADTEEGKRPFLDAIVVHANKLTLFRLHYKPYWIMSDAAALSALAYAWAFSRRFPTVSGLGLTVAVLAALFVYKIAPGGESCLGKNSGAIFSPGLSPIHHPKLSDRQLAIQAAAEPRLRILRNAHAAVRMPCSRRLLPRRVLFWKAFSQRRPLPSDYLRIGWARM